MSGEKRQTLCLFCYHLKVSYFSTASVAARLIHAFGENSIGTLGMLQSKDMTLLRSFCCGFIYGFIAAEFLTQHPTQR